jgi:hypothetical protein
MRTNNSIQPYVSENMRNFVPAEPAEINLVPRDRRTVFADNHPAPARLLIVTLCGWLLVGAVACWALARVVGSVEWAALVVVLSVIVLVFLSLIIFNGDFLGWRQIVNDRIVDIERINAEDAENKRRHKTARKAIESQERVQMAALEVQGAIGRINALEGSVSRLTAQLEAPRLGEIGGDDASSFVAPVRENSGAAFDDGTLDDTEIEAVEWVRANLYTADGRPVTPKRVTAEGYIRIACIGSNNGPGCEAHKDALLYHEIIIQKPGGNYLNLERYPSAFNLPR